MEIDLNLIEWKKKVMNLHLAEYNIERYYNERKISKKEKKEMKKLIDEIWIKIWEFHPDKNPLLEQAFKLNFS